MNLPYHGRRRITFGVEGEELSLTQFLELAKERKVSGAFFEDARIGFGDWWSRSASYPDGEFRKPSRKRQSHN